MNTAIILGAGSGTRMGLEKSKLLLEVGGKTVLERSVSAFYHHPQVDYLVVVCRKPDLHSFRDVLKAYQNVSFVFGGATRQQSVINALEAVPAETEMLLIHDGARPFITHDVITDVLQKAVITGAAASGVPVKDTIKIIDNNNVIIDTPNRSALFSIQTPQVFKYDLYQKAVAAVGNNDFTDDCQLVEHINQMVVAVKGDYSNIKITTPEDIPLAESILKRRGECE